MTVFCILFGLVEELPKYFWVWLRSDGSPRSLVVFLGENTLELNLSPLADRALRGLFPELVCALLGLVPVKSLLLGSRPRLVVLLLPPSLKGLVALPAKLVLVLLPPL